jgi:hypothetical protein
VRGSSSRGRAKLASQETLHYAALIVRDERDGAVARGLVVAAGLGMLLLALALRHYGLDLVDEGTLLAQIERVRTGQWPYRDFHSGYGPALFALNAGLLQLFGVHLEVVRVGLAVTHAVGLAALAALAARTLGVAAGAVVVALTVAFFLPIAPGAFAVWNIPYPSWYAQAAGALALLAALAVERRGGVALLASGAAWGIAFCFKQNTGVLGLAAVLVWRAFERHDEERGRAALGLGLALALAAGTFVVAADGALGATGIAALALPALALAARVAQLRPRPALLVDAGWLAFGAALVVAPTLVVTGRAVGWDAMARQILHLGSGAAAIYGTAYPGPAELGTALGGLSGGWRGLRQAMDLGWLFLLPLAHLVAALQLRAREGTRVWRLVVPAAILSYLQLYPRADFWHLLPFAGLSLIVAVGVAMPASARLTGEHSTAVSALLAALLVLAFGRWRPNVDVLRALGSPAPPPALERAAVRWDLATEPALRRVPDVVAALDGAPQVVGFPALAVFNFLSGRPSPLRDDYFFPGLLTERETRAITSTLEAARTARVVVLREPLAFFPAAFTSHAAIDAAIARAFPVIVQVGPYEIREAAR